MTKKFPQPAIVGCNDIRLAVYELGSGPPVILLHGFPELAYSWRHQLPALANAGYRAIAPDQRGYGRSDKPTGVEQYTIQKLIGDVLGLLKAYALDKAVFVGHDWGALLLWQMALSHGEKIAGMIILNIPFYASPSSDPVQLMRERLGEHFYIVNFQDSDEADRRFAADVAHFFDIMMRRNQISRARFDQLPPEKKVLSLLAAMGRKKSAGEPLLCAQERRVFIEAFEAGGFTAPINWYRNWSHNWRSYRHLPQHIDVPTLFIGANDDVVVASRHIESMKPRVSDLEIHMLENCGHWTQQEQPERVNELMLDWLARRYKV
ncbi:MAG: alpha/beta hydrolase [Gammaproteobacteria bacterium]|nr:alpha/beta hydrolase [Gammaproteobacteria bacterium]MDH4315258.1 alpha/beta hydrolase [Gammaproteobacteria bacterium]MDH5215366.1 alpha/beta hydrolase [Gammaproteobacteria bacterium]MDH5500008.1 alpha/beta hydrolase [Gammaproteobacteria bacterium]